jgi:tRNA(Arg) A34 adenosine deaminase TadA
MRTRDDHIHYLRKCIAVAQQAKELGNTPFGAILVDEKGNIVMEQGNIQVTTNNCTGHAELSLIGAASGKFDSDFLWTCTLYTSVEPCPMCAGAIFWGNVGRVVYGITGKRLAQLKGGAVNRMELPCGDVLSKGTKTIESIGPFEELEAEVFVAFKD